MTDSQSTPAKSLLTPVQYLKGVGPERADLMHRLELHTAADVLSIFRAIIKISPMKERSPA